MQEDLDYFNFFLCVCECDSPFAILVSPAHISLKAVEIGLSIELEIILTAAAVSVCLVGGMHGKKPISAALWEFLAISVQFYGVTQPAEHSRTALSFNE